MISVFCSPKYEASAALNNLCAPDVGQCGFLVLFVHVMDPQVTEFGHKLNEKAVGMKWDIDSCSHV